MAGQNDRDRDSDALNAFILNTPEFEQFRRQMIANSNSFELIS